MRANLTARERRFRERLVARAIEENAPLLAAPLDRYARAEGLEWSELAQSLGCMPDILNGIALCRPPRPERFAEDVAVIATEGMDFDRLLSLLRRLQVIAAFATERTAEAGDKKDATRGSDTILLAARDLDGDEAIDTPNAPEGSENA